MPNAHVDHSIPATTSAATITAADTSINVTPSKPNVVFVLVDDVGYNDMLDQSTDLADATPNINQLAKEGITLTRYYAELDCTPGRTTILTGKYPFTTGMAHSMVYYDSNWGLSPDYSLISDSFQENGYKTHMIGKWDIGHVTKDMWPTRRGFDTFFGKFVCEYVCVYVCVCVCACAHARVYVTSMLNKLFSNDQHAT